MGNLPALIDVPGDGSAEVGISGASQSQPQAEPQSQSQAEKAAPNPAESDHRAEGWTVDGPNAVGNAAARGFVNWWDVPGKNAPGESVPTSANGMSKDVLLYLADRENQQPLVSGDQEVAGGGSRHEEEQETPRTQDPTKFRNTVFGNQVFGMGTAMNWVEDNGEEWPENKP
jgi:hypothetical protein